MSTKTKIVLAVAAAFILGRAYGSKIPGVDTVASKLPGSGTAAA